MDELDFEIDMCTCICMWQGMSYDEAVKRAIKEVKEAHREIRISKEDRLGINCHDYSEPDAEGA